MTEPAEPSLHEQCRNACKGEAAYSFFSVRKSFEVTTAIVDLRLADVYGKKLNRRSCVTVISFSQTIPDKEYVLTTLGLSL